MFKMNKTPTCSSTQHTAYVNVYKATFKCDLIHIEQFFKHIHTLTHTHLYRNSTYSVV